MVLLNVKATACPAYLSSYVGYFRLEQAMKLKLAEINPKDPSNVPCRPYSSCSSLLMPPGTCFFKPLTLATSEAKHESSLDKNVDSRPGHMPGVAVVVLDLGLDIFGKYTVNACQHAVNAEHWQLLCNGQTPRQ